MAEVPRASAVTLRAREAPATGPAFIEAEIVPQRGMMLLRAKLRLASGEVVEAVSAPPDALAQLDDDTDPFPENRAFAFGGAVLAPFANRIRGRPVAGGREIETEVDGRTVPLRANWGGQSPGAERYAMHGLILQADVPWTQPAPHRLTGRLPANDFGGRWPSRCDLLFAWSLEDGALRLRVEARNLGGTVLPMAFGWHPYLNVPSGDRRDARLRLPAARRVEVDDYDAVLPTGRLLPVAGTPYDFVTARPLGDLYLDDCFTDLVREDGAAVAEVLDPTAGLGLRISSPSRGVRAMQAFAPADKAFVALEPQFNLADPYAAAWGDTDTGMARVRPGAAIGYEARLEAFALGTGADPGG